MDEEVDHLVVEALPVAAVQAAVVASVVLAVVEAAEVAVDSMRDLRLKLQVIFHHSRLRLDVTIG